MSSPGGVDALLERLAAGEIPTQVRLAAARGALPLSPGDLLRVQSHLALKDAEIEVREAATSTLREAKPEEIVALLDGEGFSLEAAEVFVGLEGAPAAVLAALARNFQCPDELVARFAATAGPELIDELLLNEVRLGRALAIVEALEGNEELTPGQRTRLAEIRKHLHESPEPAPIVEPELEPAVAQEMAEAMLAAEEEDAQRQTDAAEEPTEPEDEQDLTAFQRVMNLSPGERVKLAFKGNSEERALLVRDPNRIVCTSVLKSPKLNNSDVESYVKMRSLNEEVLRIIGSNRSWLRKYPIVLGLIRNPKTPPGISMHLLPRLQNRDLNILGADRNIAEVVRVQARRNFVKRTSGGRRG